MTQFPPITKPSEPPRGVFILLKRGDRFHKALLGVRERQQVAPPPARCSVKPQYAAQSERGTAKQAAAILGVPTRTIQDLAARGEIPGAAKLGRRWTFDLEKLRRLLKQKERETWQHANRQPDVSGGAKLFGGGFRFAGENSDGRFTQVIRRLRGRNTRRHGSG